MKIIILAIFSLCTLSILHAQTLPNVLVTHTLGGKNAKQYFYKKITITEDSLVQTNFGAKDPLWDNQYVAFKIEKREENNGVVKIVAKQNGSEFFTLFAFGEIIEDQLREFIASREFQTIEAAMEEKITFNDLSSMIWYSEAGMKAYDSKPTIKTFGKKEALDLLSFLDKLTTTYNAIEDATPLQKNSLKFGVLLGGPILWANEKGFNGMNSLKLIGNKLQALRSDKEVDAKMIPIFGKKQTAVKPAPKKPAAKKK